VNGIKLKPFTIVIIFPGMQVHLGDPKESQSFTVYFLKETAPKRRTSSMGSLVIVKAKATSSASTNSESSGDAQAKLV
jgi:hypothetical protein